MEFRRLWALLAARANRAGIAPQDVAREVEAHRAGRRAATPPEPAHRTGGDAALDREGSANTTVSAAHGHRSRPSGTGVPLAGPPSV